MGLLERKDYNLAEIDSLPQRGGGMDKSIITGSFAFSGEKGHLDSSFSFRLVLHETMV